MSSKKRLDFVILSDSYGNLQQLPRKTNRPASWGDKEDSSEGLIFTHSADLMVAEPPPTVPILCINNELFVGRRDSAGEFQAILAGDGSGIGVFHFTTRYLEVTEVPELHEMNCVTPPSIQFYPSRMECQEEMARILRPFISNYHMQP
jgi:hypothetical protein